MNKSVGILGIGSCLPEKVLTNFDLEKMVDTNNEWILQRTGISERRILDKESPAYEVGVQAAKRAIDSAGITAEDIDLIIVSTETPDYLAPSTACIIQREIGASKAAAFDVNAACTGFVYGITVAQQFILSGMYRYVLVVGCEALSKVIDWEDRNTCVLFGDGAGAAVLGTVEAGYGILKTYISADGSLGQSVTIPGCHMTEADIEKRIHENKKVIWMDGSEVFKFAVRAAAQAVQKVLDDYGMSMDDVKLIIPHQANIRIMQGIAKKLNVSIEKIYSIIHKYGNVSSASIPLALDEIVREKKISKGDNIVVVGFGGGLTWGATLIKWNIEI
ncbi:MAG: ketoacyl-ACP synthase III [Clostridia bacterium]|nr:ketoacyl-ACP synthase III [Clostridia bacterium]